MEPAYLKKIKLRRESEPLTVRGIIRGEHDGSELRRVVALDTGLDEPYLTPGEARRLGAALYEAADAVAPRKDPNRPRRAVKPPESVVRKSIVAERNDWPEGFFGP